MERNFALALTSLWKTALELNRSRSRAMIFPLGNETGLPFRCKWSGCRNGWEYLWRYKHILGKATDGDSLCCTNVSIEMKSMKKLARLLIGDDLTMEILCFLIMQKDLYGLDIEVHPSCWKSSSAPMGRNIQVLLGKWREVAVRRKLRESGALGGWRSPWSFPIHLRTTARRTIFLLRFWRKTGYKLSSIGEESE